MMVQKLPSAAFYMGLVLELEAAHDGRLLYALELSYPSFDPHDFGLSTGPSANCTWREIRCGVHRVDLSRWRENKRTADSQPRRRAHAGDPIGCTPNCRNCRKIIPLQDRSRFIDVMITIIDHKSTL